MDYRAILDPRQRQPWAIVARLGLRLAALPYGLAVRWRNHRYNNGRSAQFRAAVPVISVGNITAGGTGKTPMVAALAGHLRQRQIRVCLISRGYGSDQTGSNDEARELAETLPDVPHLQNPDRVAAAEAAVEELEMQAIVLDDGFQHRRLKRDFDLVMIDATCPFGYGRLLPAGLLREPLSGLQRADFIMISRSSRVTTERLAEIQATIRKLAPAIPLGTCDHAPTGWLAHQPPQSRLETRLETLSGREAVAFAGIGNPQPFFDSLQQLGINLLATRQLPDHCPYDKPAVDALVSWIEAHRRRHPDLVVLCTHKDLVKLRTTKLGGCPLWALRIELKITSGEAELWRAVERVTACIGDSPE